MGLTYQSTGVFAAENSAGDVKRTQDEKVIALAGNPNVGKSTVFNSLTGLNQHTGNWPGKTVSNAKGFFCHKDRNFAVYDLPGTYSLLASSVEEEVARDFICFGNPDVTVVVADATCLERNLNLVLQVLEASKNTVVCVNLLDEAKKKKIHVDLDELSKWLKVPVVGTSARAGRGIKELMDKIYAVSFEISSAPGRLIIRYDDVLEQAVGLLQPAVEEALKGKLDSRFVSIRLFETDETFQKSLRTFLGYDLMEDEAVREKLSDALQILADAGMEKENIRDAIVSRIVSAAENVYRDCVTLQNEAYHGKDRKIDKILTSRGTGIPIMIGFLGVIFWLTIAGANYPSAVLSDFLFRIEDKLLLFFEHINAPSFIQGALVLGIYRTVAWVVSVMLPPMAIFFPLFTLLEDSGYLPRVAFNMDRFFKKACTHGKQSLTMCMGFGCNACGVIGCRIIDSPRERLIAILTNNFVPCNGRFPTLIAIITMFFVGFSAGPLSTLSATLLLIAVILLGIVMTLLMSWLLSKTVLKGMPSSFALELPPYRMPQIGKVIVRSIFDRTLFVLRRAVVVAAPAGLVIWIMANTMAGDASILAGFAGFLDPFAKWIGLDGIILTAFILGFPANEIVFPIIIMSYLCTGSLLELGSLSELKELLTANGWTWLTAVNTMIFSLMHFPCGTTCWTIRKETGSVKWTAVAFLLPTAAGISLCFIVASAARLFCLI